MTECEGATIIARYLARTRRSAELARQAREVLPGGIVTDTRFFEPYGIYVERGLGAFKWDVDGNQYLDFFGGHGANILGHAPALVVDAVREAVGRGVQFAANQPLEVMLAREVQRLMPSVERLRFTGSGTEATLLAIRLARAFTGRSKVVRFATHYHGWHDHAASGYVAQFDGSAAPGVLAEIAAQTILVRPGDESTLERIMELHGREIAAVIIEPVGSHFGMAPVLPRFLRMVQDAAQAAGALFILDEVISGFRVALGGAQSVFNLKPDLSTLGKILCGGMPGGGVGGRAQVLDLLDHAPERRNGRAKVLHQGTFTGNPVSMAAGLAMLRAVESSDACAYVNRLGARARELFNAVSVAERLPFFWYGEFSAFHLLLRASAVSESDIKLANVPLEDFLARPQPVLNRLRMALNVLGIDVNTKCSGLLSTAHSEKDLEHAAEQIAAAGAMLRREGFV